VRITLLASSLVLASLAAGTAFAQPPVPAPAAQPTVQSGVAPKAAQPQPAAARLSPSANEALQVVNSFMADMAGGKLEAARELMLPGAIVMANGQVLGDRDHYIDGAAKGDAAALGKVHRELLHRDVNVGPNFGWILSEKRLGQPGGKGEVVTETMLLAKSAAGWKITHIHWSGRTAG